MLIQAVIQLQKKIQKELENSIKTDETSLKEIRKFLKSPVKIFIRQLTGKEVETVEDVIIQFISHWKWYGDLLRKESENERMIHNLKIENGNLKRKLKEAKVDELIQSIRNSGREVTVSFTLPTAKKGEGDQTDTVLDLYRK